MNKVISTVIAALLAIVAIPQVAQAQEQETAIHPVATRITATRLTVFPTCRQPVSIEYCQLIAPRVVQGVNTLHRITHVSHYNGTVFLARTVGRRTIRLYGVRVAATIWKDGSGLTVRLLPRPFCLSVGICAGYGTTLITIQGGFMVRDYLWRLRDGIWPSPY